MLEERNEENRKNEAGGLEREGKDWDGLKRRRRSH